MKKLKFISVFCGVLFLLCSCSTNISKDDTSAVGSTTTSNDSNIQTTELTVTEDPENSEINPDVQALINDDQYFMQVDRYLSILSQYIHSEYDYSQQLTNENLYYLIIRCCSANKSLSTAEFDDVIGSITISKNEILRIGNMLFGQDIALPESPTDYITESYATDWFGGDSRYYCDCTKMNIITNSQDSLIVEADLIFSEQMGIISSQTRMTYSFKKLYYKDITVLQLVYIAESGN